MESRRVKCATDLSSASEVGSPEAALDVCFRSKPGLSVCDKTFATVRNVFPVRGSSCSQLMLVRPAKWSFQSEGWCLVISAPTPPSARRTTEWVECFLDGVQSGVIHGFLP